MQDNIDRLLKVAMPLKLLIKKSESDKSDAAEIACEWLRTRTALTALSATHYGGAASKKKYLTIFQGYMDKGLVDAHFGAALIHPSRSVLLAAKESMTQKELSVGIEFLKRKASMKTGCLSGWPPEVLIFLMPLPFWLHMVQGG